MEVCAISESSAISIASIAYVVSTEAISQTRSIQIGIAGCEVYRIIPGWTGICTLIDCDGRRNRINNQSLIGSQISDWHKIHNSVSGSIINGASYITHSQVTRCIPTLDCVVASSCASSGHCKSTTPISRPSFEGNSYIPRRSHIF